MKIERKQTNKGSVYVSNGKKGGAATRELIRLGRLYKARLNAAKQSKSKRIAA